MQTTKLIGITAQPGEVAWPMTTNTFPSDLNDWLNRDKQLALLPDCGWMDGGCRILATALQRWIGSHAQLVAVGSAAGRPAADHVAVQLIGSDGDIVIDADGPAKGQDYLQRLRDLEGMPDPWTDCADGNLLDQHGILNEASIVDELYSRILAHYGPAASWSLLAQQPLYHITPVENLSSIMTDGLLPQIGDRSADLGGPEPAIYCFTSREACETALGSWLGDEFEGVDELAIIELQWPGDIEYSGVGYEVLIKDVVPVDSFLQIYAEDWRPMGVDTPCTTHTNFYAPA